jgi:hypothetical protein
MKMYYRLFTFHIFYEWKEIILINDSFNVKIYITNSTIVTWFSIKLFIEGGISISSLYFKCKIMAKCIIKATNAHEIGSTCK